MSSANDGRQATMDSAQIYREEIFTDRRVGTIRRLTPVDADGTADAPRPVVFVGQAQVMTPMGAVPISFELEAATLDAAIAQVRRRRGAGRAADHARASRAAPGTSLLAGHSGFRRGRPSGPFGFDGTRSAAALSVGHCSADSSSSQRA